MTVRIREIVSEVVVAPQRLDGSTSSNAPSGQTVDDGLVEAVARRAAAQVLAELRREWAR